MSVTYYKIRDWDKHFENNRTRTMKQMAWVPVKNKHDGEGFKMIMEQKDGIIIYGCWHLILQVASKCHERGTLLREDGSPITSETIALKTGWRHPEQIQKAIEFLCSSEVSWIERITDTTSGGCQVGAENPQEGDGAVTKKERKKEGKGDGQIPAEDEYKSALIIRIGSWFHRRPTTVWTNEELKVLPKKDFTAEEDLKALEEYYTHPFPKETDYRRRDLQTLLNNWSSELDRARRWKSNRNPNRIVV